MGQVAAVLTPALAARILEVTPRRPLDGSTHWSTRLPDFKKKVVDIIGSP